MGWHLLQLNHVQAICTSLQKITTPAPHQSDFYAPDALPDTQPTASKHWRPKHWRHIKWIKNKSCGKCRHTNVKCGGKYRHYSILSSLIHSYIHNYSVNTATIVFCLLLMWRYLPFSPRGGMKWGVWAQFLLQTVQEDIRLSPRITVFLCPNSELTKNRHGISA